MQMIGELKGRTTGCLLAYSVHTGTTAFFLEGCDYIHLYVHVGNICTVLILHFSHYTCTLHSSSLSFVLSSFKHYLCAIHYLQPTVCPP